MQRSRSAMPTLSPRPSRAVPIAAARPHGCRPDRAVRPARAPRVRPGLHRRSRRLCSACGRGGRARWLSPQTRRARAALELARALSWNGLGFPGATRPGRGDRAPPRLARRVRRRRARGRRRRAPARHGGLPRVEGSAKTKEELGSIRVVRLRKVERSVVEARGGRECVQRECTVPASLNAARARSVRRTVS